MTRKAKVVMRSRVRTSMLLAVLTLLPSTAWAQTLALFDGKQVAGIVHADDSSAKLAGEMLARDLDRLTGQAPRLGADLAQCGRLCIVVGARDSAIVRQVAADTGLDLAELQGGWERYARVAVRSKRDPAKRYLLIAGSDRRGAVWGVVDLTREMGVSAWEWWADVTPRRVDRIVVDAKRRLSDAPSVQYRGIFLNDEDWGLQPWAAKTYEPETGDIGPKTYSRIFELMWRLKANLIWPAMHDSTKPFYQIAGNADAAKAYDIVVGTSHAEPMMRNNVREWDEKTRGPFNFFTNRAGMVDYWRERAEQVKGYENLYTIGIRGKHDSAMEGADTPEKAREATADAIAIQRDLLARAQGKPAAQVPQALTLYKEVLDIYGTGLKVPEDVALVWPENNYGYISQLPTKAEQARSGGSGVYYHISYWGRPHDYLWLATTHPALIREQMDRAWQMQARRIWVLNVGDIKPGEYLTQYFLDLAFDARTLAPTAREHLSGWATTQFGEVHADEIAGIMTRYYDLAFERRPEFMGFSQTEPTRPIRIGDYVRADGREAHARIDAYQALAARAETMAARIPADRRDAFFQLVLYPVRAAAKINERNLTLDLASLYARQGRANVNAYADRARAAHKGIVADTLAYNEQLGGKWRGIMDMAPRRLPVFSEPPYPKIDITASRGCSIDAGDLSFVRGRPATHSLTVYSRGQDADWSWQGARGISPSLTAGRLSSAQGHEQRIAVRYNGHADITPGQIRCQDRTLKVDARLAPSLGAGSPPEKDRILSLTAADAALGAGAVWERIEGLGSRGAALRSKLSLASAETPGRPLAFSFKTQDSSDVELRIVALPVHPLTSANQLRLGIQVDDGAIQMLDFETHGRSEEWKRNVLSNTALRSVKLPRLGKGGHHVKVYAMDPGFLLDRIDVRLDGAPEYYGAPPVE